MDAEIEQSASASNNKHTNNKAHITKRYIYLGLKPVAVIDYNADNKANIAAIHTDYLGTPQAITNEKQQVVWRAEYTPFGKIRNQQAVPLTLASDTTNSYHKTHNTGFKFISTANATTNPQASYAFNLRFAGQYEDSETGYYYNWHRYYNPETGRYLTPDPIGLKGGVNAYAYTNHDPMGSVDPWGLRVIISGHLAAEPLGKLTSPNSYHLSLVLVPDNPMDFQGASNMRYWTHGTWGGVTSQSIQGMPCSKYLTLGGQPEGPPRGATPGNGLLGSLVTKFNQINDGPEGSSFHQVVMTPAGMSDTDFIRKIIDFGYAYRGNQTYDVPEIIPLPFEDGYMGPEQHNSNSYVAGALKYAMGLVPALNIPGHYETTLGVKNWVRDFQVPGYENPLPVE